MAHKIRRHPKLDAIAVQRLRDLSDARERKHRREPKKPLVSTDNNPGSTQEWAELLEQYPATQNDNVVQPTGGEENNNTKSQTAEPTEVREAQEAEEEDAIREQEDKEDSSLEEDNRSVEFFPPLNSNKAKMADRDDPKTQLNVHGITTRFLNTANAVTQLQGIHEEIVPHGYRFRPQDIIGSRIQSNNTSGGQTETIRVTYNLSLIHI